MFIKDLEKRKDTCLGYAIIKLRYFLVSKIFGLIRSKELKVFRPNSAGSGYIISQLTILAANQTLPLLSNLINKATTSKPKIYSIKNFFTQLGFRREAASELKYLFNKYGSDKASIHNYHLIYACILNDKNSISALLEIGLGTGDRKIVSHMGKNAKPGASLRAFRDFLPHTMIYGADIDKEILFKEKRIRTFSVDQTCPDTFKRLDHNISEPLDVIIDDGLHSPNANIATLTYALSKLNKGGWCIIEDIPKSALEVWYIVQVILPINSYRAYIIETKDCYVFACQKLTVSPSDDSLLD